MTMLVANSRGSRLYDRQTCQSLTILLGLLSIVHDEPSIMGLQRAFQTRLRPVVSRIVFRVKIFQSEWPHRSYLCDVLAGFRPVEMVRVSRKNDHRAGRVGFQFSCVE